MPLHRLRMLSSISLLMAFIFGCAASEDGSSSDSGVGGGPASGGAAAAIGGASVGQGGSSNSAAGGAVGRGGSATGATSAGGAVNSNAPTWAQLWTNYFEGACVSCHRTAASVDNNSRLVFANAAQLCTMLTNQRQLNGTSNPPLVSTTASVLKWFSTAGSMPEGSNNVPANAVADIKAWAAAGAVCP